MTRPSKGVVSESLGWMAAYNAQPSLGGMDYHASVLAAEVHRLQNLLDLYAETFTHVAALPAKWRTNSEAYWVESGEYCIFRDCADDIESALRGTP